MKDLKSKTKQPRIILKVVTLVAIVVAVVIGFFIFQSSDDEIKPLKDTSGEIVNGIHEKTGFIEANGMKTVISHCTACHSSKLVIQNRMNKERWNATIKWMQETQNLWELGENQEIIVNYLVENYPPVETGRRENLKDIEWYELHP